MIPKIIHYCWFGNKPLPPLAKRCIASWRKYFPYHTIKEWNENNFDVNIIPYTKEAYKAKKYAFVSDYARFWILYNYGGIYFDTDVEVIKPMDDILLKGAFMGCEKKTEKDIFVNPGLGLACISGLPLYKELLNLYASISFINKDGTFNYVTIVHYTTAILINYGFKNMNAIQNICDIYIYPAEYFCPMDKFTKEIILTENTRSIHHYDGSWLPFSYHLKKKILRMFGKHEIFLRKMKMKYFQK
jgi:mannosyltransferase OCH1-like enzyme